MTAADQPRSFRATPGAADAGAPVLTLHLEQKPNVGARVYRVFADDGTGSAKGEQIGFARQKLRALREHFTLYSDDAKTSILAEAKTQKILELGATYVVTDPAGIEVGRFRKLGRASLLRSSYVLSSPSLPDDVTITERNRTVAILRRVLGLVPYVNQVPIPWQFHFDGRTSDGRLVLSVNRKRKLLDRYQLTSYDPALDGRLLAVFGVFSDALQRR